MADKISISKQKLLLVEGSDEEEFFKQWFIDIKKEDVQILSYGGKNNLSNILAALKNIEGFDSLHALTVTRDADNSAADAFRSVSSALKKINLDPPQTNSDFKNSLNKKIGIFVIPGNAEKGMLEDLALQTYETSPLYDAAEEFLKSVDKNKCISGPAFDHWGPNNKTKSKLHILLAAKPEVQVRMGLAAQKHYINFDHPALAQLRAFLIAI